jgi:hypothetical protein
MTNESDENPAPELFGKISERNRKAALDLLGTMIIEARDRAVRQWDMIVVEGGYPPWDRLLQRHRDMDEHTREVIGETIPHIVDSFMYYLLDELEASKNVRVAVELPEMTVEDISRVSWGLAGEPTTEDGWLVRFCKERFEQPG